MNFIMTLLYADDQVIISDNEDTLQRALFELHKIILNYNFDISKNKTKSMAFQGTYPLRCKLVLDNNIIEQVNTFKFLGSSISYIKEVDIGNKVESFSKICGTIKRTLKNKVRKDTMIKFYKTMAVPAALYSSETWTMTSRDKSRLQAAEMRFLRSVLGVTKRDRIRNEDIRNQLQIFNLNEEIDHHRKKWLDHVDRMDERRYPKKILNYIPEGKRNIGRPKKRWKDQ